MIDTEKLELAQHALRGELVESEFGTKYGKQLFAHQVMAVKYAKEALIDRDSRAFGFFMKMGTGKTLTSIVTAIEIEDQWDTILYIGPKKLRRPFFDELYETSSIHSASIVGGASKISDIFNPKAYDPLKTSGEEPVNISGRMRKCFFVAVTSQNLAKQINTIVGRKERVLVILDEVHIFSNRVARSLSRQDETDSLKSLPRAYRALRKRPNVKLLLLTGTIVANRISSAIPLLNLLAPTSEITLFPERDTEHSAKVLEDMSQDPFGLVQQMFETRFVDTYVCINTPWAIEELNQPEIIFNPVEFIKMSFDHMQRYEGVRAEEQISVARSRIIGYARGSSDAEMGDYRMASRQSLNFAYPAEETSFTKEQMSDMKYLSEYTPKFAKVLQRILDKNDEGHAVHSYFINEYGLGGLSTLLEHYGFIDWRQHSKNGKLINYDVPMYALATGAEEISTLLTAMNTEENYEAITKGNGIRVLLFSMAAGTGTTFKNIQNLHLTSPMWNPSHWEQLVYRFARINSAEFIPKDKRFLNVYEYVVTSGEYRREWLNATSTVLGTTSNKAIADTVKSETSDVFIWRISRDKSIENTVIEDSIRSASTNAIESLEAENIESALYLSRNEVPPMRIFTHANPSVGSDRIKFKMWRTMYAHYTEIPNYGQKSESDTLVEVSTSDGIFDLDLSTGLGYTKSTDDYRDGLLVVQPTVLLKIHQQYTNERVK